MTHVSLILLAPLLLTAAYLDLRDLRIPNTLTSLAILLFAIAAITAPPPDLSGRLLIAGVVFTIGFTAFAFRLVGGGDVKMLSALMLFIPTDDLSTFANIFSASMLLGVLAIVTIQRVPAAAELGWKAFAAPGKFPAGISIAMAGLGYTLVAFAGSGS